MDLDDQLAALAAGELDEQTARALRARAASDPAVARRLLRLERLEELLRTWEAPSMSDAGAARLEERVDEALAALDDEPLRGSTGGAVPLQPRPSRDTRDEDRPAAAAGGGEGGEVLDLGAARSRRALPSWAPAAAVAAALAAVVGTGIVVAGVPGASDMGDIMAGQDEAADAPQTESAELESNDTAVDTTAADDAEGMAEDEAATTSAGRAGAQRYDGVELEEGQLLLLADGDAEQLVDPQGGDGEETRGAAAESCVGVALERDTAPADGREVRLLADGTYAGEPAAFVVVRTPAEPEDLVRVLAYDPDDCSLLAADETTR